MGIKSVRVGIKTNKGSVTPVCGDKRRERREKRCEIRDERERRGED